MTPHFTEERSVVTAPGYNKIVTRTFVGDDLYLGSGAIGVEQTLLAPFERTDDETEWRSNFDFVMVPVRGFTTGSEIRPDRWPPAR